jgi:DNA-binding response OmpR family regulator
MEMLILAAGAVVDPNDLSRQLWGRESFSDGERILAHVRRIRRKIEDDSSRPAFLLTVRGEGYRLADEGVRQGVSHLQLAR